MTTHCVPIPPSAHGWQQLQISTSQCELRIVPRRIYINPIALQRNKLHADFSDDVRCGSSTPTTITGPHDRPICWTILRRRDVAVVTREVSSGRSLFSAGSSSSTSSGAIAWIILDTSIRAVDCITTKAAGSSGVEAKDRKETGSKEGRKPWRINPKQRQKIGRGGGGQCQLYTSSDVFIQLWHCHEQRAK